MNRWNLWMVATLAVAMMALGACGDDGGNNTSDADTNSDAADDTQGDTSPDTPQDTASDATGDTTPDTTQDMASDTTDVGLDSAMDVPADVPVDMPMNPMCDFEARNGIVVIEAESLPLSDDWVVATDETGFSGRGYISWTGSSQNNNPGMGQIDVDIAISEAGRYRFQWYNRIGMGSNPTEHNDTWVQFPDAGDYYGLNVNSGNESRRYPRPQCDDTAFMDGINGLSQVTSASCAAGSSSGGWMKVYSSGATDWRWSTFTSDNDAHAIHVEFDTPGVYTLSLSARGDFHLIDRIHIHREDIDNNTATDLSLPETACQ